MSEEQPSPPESPEVSADKQVEPAPASGSRVEEMGEELRKRSQAAVGPRVLQVEIRYPRLYLLFVLVNLFDLIITKVAVDQLGMNEANFVAKGFLIRFGFTGFALYKLFLTALVIVLADIIARTRPRWAFALVVFGCVAVGAVVVWTSMHLLGLILERTAPSAISSDS